MLLTTGIHPGQLMICVKTDDLFLVWRQKTVASVLTLAVPIQQMTCRAALLVRRAARLDMARRDQAISYIMDDGRVADVLFEQNGSSVTITEIFQAENIHSLDMQEAGWQAILNNFKKYTEKLFNLT